MFNEEKRKAKPKKAEDITTRRQVDENLWEDERAYRTLCDNISGMVYRGRYDWSTEIISNSKNICGYSPEDFNSKEVSWLDIIHPDDKQKVLLEDSGLEGKAKTLVQNYRIIDRDGHIRWVEDHKTIYFVKADKRVDGVVFDVTARRHAEDEIRKFKTIADDANYGVAISNLDGTLTYINEYFAAIHGYAAEQLIGKNLTIFHNEEQLTKVSEANQKLKVVEKLNAIEIWHTHKDGMVFPMLMNTLIIKDENNQPMYMAATAVDITDQKKAEKAIKESEERYKTLFQDAAEGIVVADIETKKFKYANPAICRMLGYTEEEIKRMYVQDIHPKENLEYVFSEFEAQARGEKTLSPSSPCLRKDGTIIYVNINAAKVRIDGRDCNVGFFTDITEYKRIEDELEKYKEKVLKAQRHVYIGSMGAIAAHQINQPLTKINILLDRALDNAKNESCWPSVIKDVKEGLAEVKKAVSIIRKFRQYSKNSDLEGVGEVNLSVVADRIVSMLSRRAKQAKMHISAKGLTNLPEVETNETALEQIFLIIIQNAIEAADDKKRHKLDIAGKVINGNIELQFSDDCCGIAPENIDRIFEPFFSTKTGDKGMGLGLDIVQQILISYGGKIRVESELGKGTVFYVTLPVGKIRKP